MSPLYLYLSRRLRVDFQRNGSVVAVALGLLCGMGTLARAQDDANARPAVAPQPAPAINFRERPKYPTDPQRLRRTVQVDGTLGDGEWDPFYTVTDGPIKGTVYCQWDDNYLYLAARTDQAATLLFDIDAGGDGWLRGSDNLELVVGNLGDGTTPTLAARLLDAANSKDTPAWNEKAIDTKGILVAAKTVNGTQVVEVAIPKNSASLVLRTGATIGLRAEFLPPGAASAYVPTAPFEPHLLLDANLVESRVQSAPGINPRLTISDAKCVPGQTLFATLELYNQTDQKRGIKSVQWTGQGNSVNAVNTVREVSVPPLLGLKRSKLTYKTLLPSNLATGSYTLMVTVEMEDGKQVQSLTSFSVVEPIQVQMSAEPNPVAVAGMTKLAVIVDVFSAVPRNAHGDVELAGVPAGWELEGKPKRGFWVDREDARTGVRFTLKLPSTTPAGDYPFEATVTWNKRAWKAHCVAHVVRTGDAKK